MFRKSIVLIGVLISLAAAGQKKSLDILLSDSTMTHASVSLCILNASEGEPVFEYYSQKSLIPASTMKLLTSSAALELLGPELTFKTTIGYTGTLDRKTGRLQGDIVIRGGGDPVLGSEYFKDHYGNFTGTWITQIRKSGIKQVEGRIITDDSRYDYQPVPAGWLWEDPGNYYGAGAHGLSVFDNTYEIHFRTGAENSFPVLTRIVPEICRNALTNMLISSGYSDQGYVFAAPYSNSGWIAGSIPVNRDDFVLKASIPDPPLLLAKILDIKLDSAGITVSGNPSTARLEKDFSVRELTVVSETISPPLGEIIEVLNHESVNLIAEHLVKELGREYRGHGSTAAGIEAVYEFLVSGGVSVDGLFMEDGSGLSPLNSINSGAMAKLLFHMKKRAKYFDYFYSSLPEAGKEGTLKNRFHDPLFERNLRAKSGSMTRVISYAGYFRASSGKELIFCIIINNYSGSSQQIIAGIESVIKETIIGK
jgi:D-alanyl-D-alanine carboxypeptidase/D-alanyl-D-alanine-endopeptidase (penicillin-binding protein 4)